MQARQSGKTSETEELRMIYGGIEWRILKDKYTEIHSEI